MKEYSDIVTISLEDVPSLAKNVLQIVEDLGGRGASVIFLEGDLGAGKTTFTQALAKELRVSERVSSPTFILKKEYKVEHDRFTTFIHIDAYRFDTPKEGNVLRLENDLASSEKLIVIEWPYKLAFQGKPSLVVEFEIVDEMTRRVTLHYEK